MPLPDAPLLRGWLHLVTAPLALIGGIALIVLSPSPSVRVALIVFTLTAVALFTVSAIYHIGSWLPPTKAALRRADHSNIFLIIAGTYTPLSLILLPADQARTLLIIVWSGAIAGVLIRNFWLGAPRWIYVPIYLALGWVAVFYLPAFAAAGGLVLGLVVAGGVLYSVGAGVYALKWPEISPKWFGFHELFHSFTILAFVAHFGAIAIVATT